MHVTTISLLKSAMIIPGEFSHVMLWNHDSLNRLSRPPATSRPKKKLKSKNKLGPTKAVMIYGKFHLLGRSFTNRLGSAWLHLVK
jgi:hypothetical protein